MALGAAASPGNFPGKTDVPKTYDGRHGTDHHQNQTGEGDVHGAIPNQRESCEHTHDLSSGRLKEGDDTHH
jgi:hypothetical protein